MRGNMMQRIRLYIHKICDAQCFGTELDVCPIDNGQ